MASTGTAIPPVDPSQYDLHVTNYNSVEQVNFWLSGIDDAEAANAADQDTAQQAANDLSGQSDAVSSNIVTASAHVSNIDPSTLATGSGDVDAYITGGASIISAATDTVNSANQPLTTLQSNAGVTDEPVNAYSVEGFEQSNPDWATMTPDERQLALYNWCLVNPDADGCTQVLAQGPTV
jgi:hypothetical protein